MFILHSLRLFIFFLFFCISFVVFVTNVLVVDHIIVTIHFVISLGNKCSPCGSQRVQLSFCGWIGMGSKVIFVSVKVHVALLLRWVPKNQM